MLTITLDESDCFAAWVSAKDAGFSSSDGSDPKCKISDEITCYMQINMKSCRTMVVTHMTLTLGLHSEPGWTAAAGSAGVLAQNSHQPHGRGRERGEPW